MKNQMPLWERKQLQARERIVNAANELFRERGFDAVSVTDIVDRAEVGRTSFFRYFGDKQEVVFARDQELVDAISGFHGRQVVAAPGNLAEAIAQLRDIVVSLCAHVTADSKEFTRHYELVDGTAELRARDTMKLQRLAQLLGDILVARGADPAMAVFASQLALACYQAAQLSAGRDPRTLVPATEAMFDRLLRLGDREQP